MRARSIACAVLFLASVGCESSTSPLSDSLRDLGPVPDDAFTTDATGYVAREFERLWGQPRYRFTVVSRFVNRGPLPLFLGRCYPDSTKPTFSVVLADMSPTESAYSGAWACVGHDRQFVVAPGSVRVDTVEVQGPNMFDGMTHRPFGITEGAFRLYFDVRLAPGDGAPSAPMHLRVSNAFIVRTSN